MTDMEQQPHRQRPFNGFAIASLVLGGLWVFWLGSILALVFGYIARSQLDQTAGGERGRGLAIAGITLGWVGVATLLLLVLVWLVMPLRTPQMPGPMMGRVDIRDDAFASNGERIYFTGTSRSGDDITYEEGPGGGMMSGVLTCADCHGPRGQGGEVRMMMQSFQVPDIRWESLTGEHGGHGEGESDVEGDIVPTPNRRYGGRSPRGSPRVASASIPSCRDGACPTTTSTTWWTSSDRSMRTERSGRPASLHS